jgi:hypothetical protein
MCIDCVLASPRIAQGDPSDGPLPEVVLSHLGDGYYHRALNIFLSTLKLPIW